MIDTDKYEGHTSDWKWIDINEQDDFYLHSEHGDIINHDTPDGKLAQDAPLLLAEVKRLREVMIHVEQRQPHPALEMALKQGLYLSEIRERIE